MAEVGAEDSSDSDVEENLGILRPTVLDQIKEILREYRNDVQIIKVTSCCILLYLLQGIVNKHWLLHKLKY